MKKLIIKPLLFITLLIGVLLFFIWSKILAISLILIFIIDSVTFQFSSKFFRKLLPKLIYKTLIYSYYLFLPIFLAVFIRTFFFDIYHVPSSSMEATLFPNDFVIVDKISYGTKIPNQKKDIPIIGFLFKSENSTKNSSLYRTLHDFKSYEREDIVVFKSIENHSKFLIKRIIGLPGDTLKIENTIVKINKNELLDKNVYSYNYLDSLGEGFEKSITLPNHKYISLHSDKKRNLKKDIKQGTYEQESIFPYYYAKSKKWTRDNYGEIIIPKKGMKIILNEFSLSIYKSTLENFENISTYSIGQIYTFKNDYYFVIGDNRHNSIDSRMFGFVPDNFVQGKMIGVTSIKRIFN